MTHESSTTLPQTADGRPQTTGDRRRMADSIRQAVDGGRQTTYGRQETADGRPQTADGRPLTAGGRRWTADRRRQKTENRWQTADADGGWRSADHHCAPVPAAGSSPTMDSGRAAIQTAISGMARTRDTSAAVRGKPALASSSRQMAPMTSSMVAR